MVLFGLERADAFRALDALLPAVFTASEGVRACLTSAAIRAATVSRSMLRRSRWAANA